MCLKDKSFVEKELSNPVFGGILYPISVAEKRNSPMTISRIVITGGPCAGKTTALSRVHEAFAEMGYTVDEVTPVNMFPRTKHCESVALLSRKSTTHQL